jgi:hypothetical protein
LNTASAAGLLASMGSAPYGVTKHAAVALAEHLAIQYGDRGITVSVLCPQAVDTNMLRMAGSTSASVDGVLNTDAVAQSVIEAMDAETFLILPHPEVKEYMARKLDRDRWLRGMRRLRDKTGEGDGLGRRPGPLRGTCTAQDPSASLGMTHRHDRVHPASVRRQRSVDRARRDPGGRADARLRGLRLGHADGADLRHPVRLAEMVVTVVAIELIVSLQLFPQVRVPRRLEDADADEHRRLRRHAARRVALASVDKGTIVTAVSASSSPSSC